jgi:hypothetical protein
MFGVGELASAEDVLQLQFEIETETKKIGEVEKVLNTALSAPS